MASKNYGLNFNLCRCEIGEDNVIWLIESSIEGNLRYYNLTEEMRKIQDEPNINVKVSLLNKLSYT